MSLRIAYVISTDSRFGGAERLLRSLIEGGYDQGYDQLVLNPFVRTWPPELGSAFPPAAYQACRYRGVLDLRSTRAFVRLALRRFRPDIVHVTLLRAALTTATLATAVPGTRWVLTHSYGEGGSARRRATPRFWRRSSLFGTRSQLRSSSWSATASVGPP